MKKAIKLISILAILAVLATFLVCFVGCNKTETETISKEEAITAIQDITSNTANVKDFVIEYSGGKTSFNLNVMAVKNSSAAKGTLNGDEIFIGQLIRFKGDTEEENILSEPGIYILEDGEYSLSESVTTASKGIEEVGCYLLIDYLEDIPFDDTNLNITATKTTVNGNVSSYNVKITMDDESIEFTTLSYQGKQVISAATTKEGQNTETFKYSYGKTFEIPEE